MEFPKLGHFCQHQNVNQIQIMDQSFLITPGYKLSGTEYTRLVKKFSTITPRNSINSENLQNRFLSLINKSYIEKSNMYQFFMLFTCREHQTFAIPTRKEAELILAYEDIIVRLGGRYFFVFWDFSITLQHRVPADYYTVVFNVIKRIPYSMSKQNDRSELHTLTKVISVFLLL